MKSKIINKLLTWLMGGAATLTRRAAVAIVGWLAGQNLIGEDVVEPGVTFVAGLLMGVLELGLFLWRTRNGKAVQKAVGAKQDGVIGAETVKAVENDSIPKRTPEGRGGRNFG